MDEKLKEELREFGLLPVSLDEKAQEFYRKLGRDPSKIEQHYNPGTPIHILEREKAIDRNVGTLCEMEKRKQTSGEDYIRVVEAIRNDLQYLRNQTIQIRGNLPFSKDTMSISVVCIPLQPATGVCGINRDPYTKKP